MKKKIILIAILMTQVMPAYSDVTVTTETTHVEQEAPMEEIALEDSPAKKPVDESNMQNWLFAAGTLVLGTIAAIIVGTGQGESP